MSDQLQNGTSQYSDVHPRRSIRQRSVVDRFQAEFTRKQPTRNTARSRTRSRTRSAAYYAADEVPQAPLYIEHKNGVKSNLMEVGITRIPTLYEVMKISTNVIDMRWKEIHLVKTAIDFMKENNTEEWLINAMQQGVDILQWEMDPKNVRENDLPKLGPETTNFADISVWLIHFYELLHENMHRIIDLLFSFKMLTTDQRKSLKKYEGYALNVMNDFKKNVEDFKLPDQSKERYKKITEEIRKNCAICK